MFFIFHVAFILVFFSNLIDIWGDTFMTALSWLMIIMAVVKSNVFIGKGSYI